MEDPSSVLVTSGGGGAAPAVPEVGELTVETVDDPARAIDRIEDGGVDCLVLDAGGDPDGALTVLAEVRDRFPELPVVVATDEDAVAERALSAGAAEVVFGSLDATPPAVVENRIRRVLGSSNRCEDPIEDRGRILNRAVDALDDIIYVVDEDESPVAWNRALPERLGYTDEEIAEVSATDVFPEDQWDEATADEGRGREHDDRIIEFDLLTRDDERIPHEFRSSWFEDEVTGTGFRVGIARDVTDRDRHERTLKRHNDRFVEFADSLVAELRNCLSVGYAAVKLSRDDPDRGVDGVEEALAGIETIVENAEDLARAGRAVVEPSDVPLGSAARSAWEDLDATEATMRVEDDPRVRCDPARLRRLLMLLFENAVEHYRGTTAARGGEDDGVGRTPLEVRVGTLGDGFYVDDDGIGIPSSERDLVFHPGYSTAEDAEGMGLAVVAEIAAAHGWEVSVAESEDGGARFEVRGVEFAEELRNVESRGER